jgi:hypothetical protein
MMGHAKRLERERNQWREKAEAREILKNQPPEKQCKKTLQGQAGSVE